MSKLQHGWVNFPVDDQRYTNTREGGMFVKLVIMSDCDGWTICSDVTCFDIYNNPLVSHDPEMFYEPGQYMSHAFLACIVLGLTNWSGWDEECGKYWKCTFDDLTDAGKVLYNQIQELYKGCDLHLLTYLDT